MRKYNTKNEIQKITCNMCKRELKIENGIVKEGVFGSEYLWNYFSDKDGQVHSFDLCESCYDKLMKQFKIRPEIKETTELI
ncbi:MAG: hypothetical protein K1W19_13350 [Lachnospiraceae bacterium]|nr:hypothetical protein [Lachnospiraceae bacterium]MCI8826371.1 hypothetical protein [Lachnospiraceae bacterium]MCI9371172.1 hypothetical protein [Lachnospiraceae bacterium]